MSRDRVPQHEFMLVVFKASILIALLWACASGFAYSAISHRLGWDTLSLETSFLFFVLLNLAGAAIVAVLGTVAYLTFKRLAQR